MVSRFNLFNLLCTSVNQTHITICNHVLCLHRIYNMLKFLVNKLTRALNSKSRTNKNNLLKNTQCFSSNLNYSSRSYLLNRCCQLCKMEFQLHWEWQRCSLSNSHKYRWHKPITHPFQLIKVWWISQFPKSKLTSL